MMMEKHQNDMQFTHKTLDEETRFIKLVEFSYVTRVHPVSPSASAGVDYGVDSKISEVLMVLLFFGFLLPL